MSDTSKSKQYNFRSIINNWDGYVSSVDRTNVAENLLVRGSQNVYKKLSGTIANRPGLKRLGVANTTISPISSEYVWNTSWGTTYVMVVSNSNLYVVKNNVWYSLATGLTKTRYVFSKWFNTTEQKDRVLFVKGDSDIQHWSGGMATINGKTTIVTGINSTPTLGGLGYVVGDVLTIVDIPAASTPCTVTVTAVSSIGAITQIILTTSGSGYTVGANKVVTGGSGTSATVEITSVSSPTSTTLTLQDVTKSWMQYGFASQTAGEKKFKINGVEFIYTGGESTNTLTGITPVTTGSLLNASDGDIAIQSIVTVSSTPNVNQTNDFIKVINNQAYIGSYTGRLIYISSNTSFTNFTIPSPRVAGSPELITLDAVGKGIGVRQGKAHIGFGASSWAVISFNDVTVGTTLTQKTDVDIKPMALLQAPYAHEFIDSTGDSLIYLAQDQQVRTYGDFNNAFVASYPSISQEIARELEQETFTGGGLRSIGEFIYLTAPNSGKTYLYQVRTRVNPNGEVVGERLWHSPFIWNATRIDQIDGVVVAFSSANPQIYQCWGTDQWYDDSPSDEHLPYSCVMALGYRGTGRRQGLWSFDKQFTEGYITKGTPLNFTLNYDYQGSKNSIVGIINDSAKNPAYLFNESLASLGDSTLGDEPLGEGGIQEVGNDDNSLPKFKCINSLNIINCFEWQPIFYSDSADARWEMLAVGDNAEIETEQNATFIINKNRN